MITEKETKWEKLRILRRHGRRKRRDKLILRSCACYGTIFAYKQKGRETSGIPVQYCMDCYQKMMIEGRI